MSEQEIRAELQRVNCDHLAYAKEIIRQAYKIEGVNVLDAMAYDLTQTMNMLYLADRFGE